MEHLRCLGVGLRAVIVAGIVVGLVLLLAGCWALQMPCWVRLVLAAVLLLFAVYVVGWFLTS